MIQDTLLWGTTALGGVAVQVAGHQESVLDMVLGAGPVVRAVLIILLGFSVGCGGVAIGNSIEMRRARRPFDCYLALVRYVYNLPAIQAAIGVVEAFSAGEVHRGCRCVLTRD